MEEQFRQEQQELLNKLRIPDPGEGYLPEKGDLIVAMDIQYQEEWAFVAMDLHHWEEDKQEIYLSQEMVSIPYVPGYFAFREGPLLQSGLQKLIQQIGQPPNLLIIDGHGTAHPRKMGLASWLGIQMDLPSIGVAKDTLLTFEGHIATQAGSIEGVYLQRELVGYVLRSQTNVKPIFVSAGHQISQSDALALAYQMRSDYRIIEPIRRADQAARKFARGQMEDMQLLPS